MAAFGAASFSYQSYLRRAAPDAAHAKYPTDGIAIVSMVNAFNEKNPLNAPSAAIARDAAASLVERPLNEGAVRILGAHYEATGRAPQATAAMLLSNRVSRRDPINQMWLIEYAIGRNDIPGAIGHYNAALSVQPKLGALLYPILSNALAFPEVRSALAPYAVGDAKWMPDFIAAAADSAPIENLKPFVLSVASQLSGPTYQTAAMTIAHRLAISGDIAATKKLLAQTAPGNAARLDDLGLLPDARDPRLGRLGWWLSQTDQLNATVNDDGSVFVIVAPEANGAFATRDIVVTPGAKYRINFRFNYIDNGPKASARLDVYCIGINETTQLSEVRIPASDRAAEVENQFSPPADCQVARVTFSASGPQSQIPTTISISNLKLSRSL